MQTAMPKIASNALNTHYLVSFFPAGTAFYTIGSEHIVVLECDNYGISHTVYDIITNPDDLPYSAYICVGLLSPEFPYPLAQ